jgi:hypothetical protein
VSFTISKNIAAAIAVAVGAVVVGWLALKRYPPLRKSTEKTQVFDDED